jgi:hypothetical protein
MSAKTITLTLPAETLRIAKAAALADERTTDEWLAAILITAVPHHAAGESLARHLETARERRNARVVSEAAVEAKMQELVASPTFPLTIARGDTGGTVGPDRGLLRDAQACWVTWSPQERREFLEGMRARYWSRPDVQESLARIAARGERDSR